MTTPEPHTPHPETAWQDLAPAADIEADGHRCINAADREVIAFHTPRGFSCMANVCPHAGLPLHEGEVRGMTITCPYHAYTYHTHTGKNIDFPEFEPPATMYPTRVTDAGILQAQLPPTKPTT
ncbi:MAG: Rieske (2Fe-2S) protein [Planctomycetota bacterium]